MAFPRPKPSSRRSRLIAESSSCISVTEFLTEFEAAHYLGLSPATLQTWRCTGRVRLDFVKVGRAVRYRLKDLEAFAQANLRSTTT